MYHYFPDTLYIPMLQKWRILHYFTSTISLCFTKTCSIIISNYNLKEQWILKKKIPLIFATIELKSSPLFINTSWSYVYYYKPKMFREYITNKSCIPSRFVWCLHVVNSQRCHNKASTYIVHYDNYIYYFKFHTYPYHTDNLPLC